MGFKVVRPNVPLNTIFNEDCFVTMDKIHNSKLNVYLIMTSPPYNTGKKMSKVSTKSREKYDTRYDIYLDNKTDEQYIDWTNDLFKYFDMILKPNGVILYNMSYGSDGNGQGDLVWKVIASIISNSNFTIADRIIWKKKSALPNNSSSNKLTRIVEDVFVFVRKSEYRTFESNKQLTSVSSTGQKYYENIFNFIEAKNNDGVCEFNKATYSSDLCVQLFNIYCKKGSIVYDPFIGSGTTAVACKMYGCKYLGSELSENQCKFAKDRLDKIKESEKHE